jgi:hypothetical protein
VALAFQWVGWPQTGSQSPTPRQLHTSAATATISSAVLGPCPGVLGRIGAYGAPAWPVVPWAHPVSTNKTKSAARRSGCPPLRIRRHPEERRRRRPCCGDEPQGRCPYRGRSPLASNGRASSSRLSEFPTRLSEFPTAPGRWSMRSWSRSFAGPFDISSMARLAEHMVVYHNMVVTQVFRRLGKRLDRPCIAAKFDLRIRHRAPSQPRQFALVSALRVEC